MDVREALLVDCTGPDRIDDALHGLLSLETVSCYVGDCHLVAFDGAAFDETLQPGDDDASRGFREDTFGLGKELDAVHVSKKTSSLVLKLPPVDVLKVP